MSIDQSYISFYLEEVKISVDFDANSELVNLQWDLPLQFGDEELEIAKIIY
jgi:hypothetical protein